MGFPNFSEFYLKNEKNLEKWPLKGDENWYIDMVKSLEFCNLQKIDFFFSYQKKFVKKKLVIMKEKVH